ncbi:MAG: metalloregulator ArsR/SmtB family transcription factor [Deltaproteobacteria bacterium]|nr:metalloregulator ArsR/SmtB family transcription factor [Deltaproteobacteria bacterium]
MRDLAAVFRALADETRLELLALLLRHGELCVCDLQATLGIGQSKTSRHLQYLRHAGLLTDRRAGLWVHYRIATELDPERKAMVAVLRRLLANERAAELEARFRRWSVRKAREGASCRPQPVSKPRAAKEARP